MQAENNPALPIAQILDLAARCGVKGKEDALVEFTALVRDADPLSAKEMRPPAPSPQIAEDLPPLPRAASIMEITDPDDVRRAKLVNGYTEDQLRQAQRDAIAASRRAAGGEAWSAQAREFLEALKRDSEAGAKLLESSGHEMSLAFNTRLTKLRELLASSLPDAAMPEPVYQVYDIGSGWMDVAKEQYDRCNAKFRRVVYLAAQPAEKVDVAMPEPVPKGVYFGLEGNNFYNTAGFGMGTSFFRRWQSRWEEFPRTQEEAKEPLAAQLAEKADVAMPEQWISEVVGPSVDDLSYGQGYRDGWNDCRTKFLAYLAAQPAEKVDVAMPEQARPYAKLAALHLISDAIRRQGWPSMADRLAKAIDDFAAQPAEGSAVPCAECGGSRLVESAFSSTSYGTTPCRACAPAEGSAQVAMPELTVWYGSLPESNGKSNFTAILLRKGGSAWEGMTDGITIDQSEYPDRVRYEADRMRYLIGELDQNPDILDYDADKHSGYVEPERATPAAVERAAPAEPVANLAISGTGLSLLTRTKAGYALPAGDYDLFLRPTPATESADTCPTCKGNDADAPCAYPGKGMTGCIREARFAAEGATQAARRLQFLHSVNKDRDGYEYGVAKVKFSPSGHIESFLWALSDHSDIDAEIARIDGNKQGDQTGEKA